MKKEEEERNRNFSLDEFLESKLLRLSAYDFSGSIRRDGDHLIINPAPCTSNAVLRVHASFVEIGERFAITCNDGRQEEVRRLSIRREAPCLRIEAGRAAEFLECPGLFGDVGVRVQNAKIKFNADGTGTLSYSNQTVPCLGKVNFPYKADTTNQGVEGTDKFKQKYSNEFQAWMYWAVLIDGGRGVYIHEGATTGTSAGCIHLAATTAEDFYRWVDRPTRITISVPW